MMAASTQGLRHARGISVLVLAAGLGFAQPTAAGNAMTFTVTVEQMTTDHTLKLPDGSATKAPISPGIALVHSGANPLFMIGKPAAEPIQRIAEAGQPEDAVAAMKKIKGVSQVVMFERTDTFTIRARPGDMLTFATMFGQSNDCFYAPKGSGDVALFDKGGKPMVGEHAVEVVLYDAGTEVNQAPGIGPDQGPRQDPKTWRQGELEHATVQPVRDTFAYPPVAEVIRVTISPAKSS
jgi:hypothetical protein